MTGESVDEMSLSSLLHHLISSQCSTDGYDSMTVAQLKELCKEAGISSSGKKKADLIAALTALQEQEPG
jgi:hypothetical protein